MTSTVDTGVVGLAAPCLCPSHLHACVLMVPVAINLFLPLLKFLVLIGPVSLWSFLLGLLSSLLAIVAFPGRAVACSHLRGIPVRST